MRKYLFSIWKFLPKSTEIVKLNAERLANLACTWVHIKILRVKQCQVGIENSCKCIRCIANVICINYYHYLPLHNSFRLNAHHRLRRAQTRSNPLLRPTHKYRSEAEKVNFICREMHRIGRLHRRHQLHIGVHLMRSRSFFVSNESIADNPVAGNTINVWLYLTEADH